jgi:predicted amidophosphoribosyltransferase
VTLQLQRIDELLLPEHSFLTAQDHCFFLREYTSGAGFGHGETNDIISNLKKKLDRRGKPEWRYKEAAIQQAGRELRVALTDHLLTQFTIVPMPPSKSKQNPMYDDRVLRIVRVMTSGLSCDVRELIVQPNDMTAAHETSSRPRPEDWYAAYVVDEAVAQPPPTSVLVIDDVLTAGAHFVGLKRRLLERFPGVTIFGVFYARRAVQQEPAT